MKTWEKPKVPVLPGAPPTLKLRDSLDGRIKDHQREQLNLWVCGITPYDATHLGHANTYVFFDVLLRTWIDGGRPARYAQNLTDMDDPLYERAQATQVYWRALAQDQTDLFRSDMVHLRVIPPDSWVSVSEKLDDLESAVRVMEKNGIAYRIQNSNGTEDIYVDSALDLKFVESDYFDNLNLELEFNEHGGDSQRTGKRHALDPQVWKGVRGDDYRPADLEDGEWRPGWHIECAVIAHDELGMVDVQGGGSDLLFPHHEMSELHLRQLRTDFNDGEKYESDSNPVGFHLHSGMVAFEGTKMSKSLGNLVLVSKLVAQGVDPRAIRLAILSHHYREDWEYETAVLDKSVQRLKYWQEVVGLGFDDDATSVGPDLLAEVRFQLSEDLRTPDAIDAIDRRFSGIQKWKNVEDRQLVIDTIDALLGVKL
ncbi:hypothetical protein [Arcanobacterium ihumii]|uniref:hypothetical protein n=1 Tax=Arcanobacterium ihumii TaxID=2138162 RepID=UPI000F548E8F|nr:hypothetical protein [Arcanobacterium ihumii]